VPDDEPSDEPEEPPFARESDATPELGSPQDGYVLKRSAGGPLETAAPPGEVPEFLLGV
jgi:hypothetical protein